MTATTEKPNMTALLSAVDSLPLEFFTAYRGGYPNSIGLALVDAVYSIQASYDSEHSGKGVLNRVKQFRSDHSNAVDDLCVLADLDEDAIQKVMGEGKTSQRTKSGAVLEAARALAALEPPIVRAADFTAERREDARGAYTRVHGLGKVTFTYFTMHLGVPGVKADSLLTRFVARHAYGDKSLKLSSDHVVALVNQAYESRPQIAETVTHFEHALWRAESKGDAN
ncbi:hypothetical protein [Nesterenkonia halotolerans]|uniref:Heme peroxidase n=1 Tax=Nesterenkonia halotolerans TaxID=225325 RepID=A0ABR9J5V5_9MICC|nr:hypothetical protein [Nesterenkonia halotolerans]MBE1514285.1 hypothetical protein [Nesterenkonia halotolerans]